MLNDQKVWDWRGYILEYAPEIAPLRQILLTLSCYMNSAGDSCFPTVDTLVKATSLSKPTVIKYLAMADQEGWIEVSTYGFNGQNWKRNEYKASIPEKVVKEIYRLSNGGKTGTKTGDSEEKTGDYRAIEPFSKEHEISISDSENVVKEVNRVHKGGKPVEQGGKPHNEGGKPDSEKVVKEVNPISSYNSSSNSPTNTPPARVILFNQFFDEYGKPVKEEEAHEQWKPLNSADRQAAIDFIATYKAIQPNRRYRKDPDNYLSSRFWEKDGPMMVDVMNSKDSQIKYYSWSEVVDEVTRSGALTTDDFSKTVHPLTNQPAWIKKVKSHA